MPELDPNTPDRWRYSTKTKYEFQFGYSRAVRHGSVIRVAGTAGLDDDGNPVPGGITDQMTEFGFDRTELGILLRRGAGNLARFRGENAGHHGLVGLGVNQTGIIAPPPAACTNLAATSHTRLGLSAVGSLKSPGAATFIPMRCRKLISICCPRIGARPHKSDPKPKIPRQVMKIRRRPNMSETRPMNGIAITYPSR